MPKSGRDTCAVMTRALEPSRLRQRGRWGTRLALPALLATLLTTACSHGAAAPTPAPTPSPTWSCTPQNSIDPPCTQARAQEQAKLNADYEAAEKAYRAFAAEWSRLTVVDHYARPTPVMLATAGGPYLRDISNFLITDSARGWHSTVGFRVVYVKREPDLRRSSSPMDELTLLSCEDASKNVVVDRDGRVVGRGVIGLSTLYMRPVDGHWRVWDADGKRVARC